MKQPLIVLTGPTASGKTALSIGLAKAIGGEIISADSMQVYRQMDIGTAKIRPEEMEGVPHYLVDVLEPDASFNVVIFQQMAREAMARIRANGHIPIIVGGTGFYIQAVLYGISQDICVFSWDIPLGNDLSADRVVDIMIDVCNFIGEPHDLSLQGRRISRRSMV